MPYRLAIPHYDSLEKPPVRFMTRPVRTPYHTSGNLPESPTTTPHGQWSHLSGKVFHMTLLVGCISCLVEKSVSRDSNPKHICVLSVDLLLLLCPLSYIPITAL